MWESLVKLAVAFAVILFLVGWALVSCCESLVEL